MAMANELPFVCVADGNVVPGVLSLLTSAYTHLRSGWTLRVYVIDLGMTEDDRRFVLKAMARAAPKLEIVFRSAPVDIRQLLRGNEHLSVAAYGRYFIAASLPEETWAIYADVDVIVRCDLATLSQECVAQGYLAAALDWNGTIGDRIPSDVYSAAGADAAARYFNSGFLILNLERWRKEAVLDSLVALSIAYGDRLRYLDQDVMNLFFSGRWVRLEQKYNTLFPLRRNLPRRIPRKPCNLHMVGRYKPWMFRRKGARGLVKVFYDYLDKTGAGYDDCPGASLSYPRGWRLAASLANYYVRRLTATGR